MLLPICFVLYSFVTTSGSLTSSSVHLYVSAYFFLTYSEDLDIFSINYKLRQFTPCSSYGVEEMTPKSQLYMHMLIAGFSPAKELGTRANQKISGYNLIRVDG